MPYRIDIDEAPSGAFDTLVALGALDAEAAGDGLAAIMPDAVSSTEVAAALGAVAIRVSEAQGRDAGSVWILTPRAVRVGRVVIAPAGGSADAGAVRLQDSAAFGTGLHPSTALCLEALDEALDGRPAAAILDVGTGSGVLALSALHLGAGRATAIDIDMRAVAVARDNARLNGMSRHVHFVCGGPEALRGTWPLVVANLLAAPLVAMAPALARSVAPGGSAIVSGIRASLASDVVRACTRVGMHQTGTRTRDGWTSLSFNATW